MMRVVSKKFYDDSVLARHPQYSQVSKLMKKEENETIKAWGFITFKEEHYFFDLSKSEGSL